MEINNITNLLNQVSAIRKQYEKVAELSGENFNIFKILKLTSDEVRTHSAFLAELLNPQGSHGQKDEFLKIFINHLKITDFIAENANIKVEHHIAYKTEDEGGRIDILLKDKNGKHIIIENKIYAGDQENQLIRYHNFDQNAPILYLTLYGNEANDYTKATKDQSIPDELLKCISYKTDIIEWLELCRKEAAMHPILRESITQYINLIKYLTGQTMSEELKNEIAENIVNSEINFKSAELISNNIYAAKLLLISNFKNQLQIQASNQSIDLIDDSLNFTAHSNLTLTSHFLKENNLCFSYAPQSNNLNDICNGIRWLDLTMQSDDVRAKLIEFARIEFGSNNFKSTPYYPVHWYDFLPKTWDNNVFVKIIHNKLANEFISRFKLIEEFAKRALMI
ncbi:MAG: PD-(D/E)XK nuclease family protein [Bacteroidota bacterium]